MTSSKVTVKMSSWTSTPWRHQRWQQQHLSYSTMYILPTSTPTLAPTPYIWTYSLYTYPLYILLANPNQNIPYTQELTLKTLQLSNLSCIGRTTLPRTTSLWICSVAVTSRKCTTDAQWNPPSLRCEPQGSRDRTNGSAASRLFLKFLQFSFLPWMCDREGVDVALSNRGGCFVNISVNQYRM